ncbi:MAG: hypothetical protein HC811_09360 [Flammeovirgaceae bacterium]|nr:hypothetical protein [Flammeovirgaceae bacterium]
MKNEDYSKDLASIRNLMERSVKVISLSGLSGILSGIYAIAGAAAAFWMADFTLSSILDNHTLVIENLEVSELFTIAFLVLTASIFSGLYLSHRKAKQHNQKLWNQTSRHLIINLSIPLIVGGLFILILTYNGQVNLLAPSCLIFYGLALINASSNTYTEVRYLGFSEIALGLFATLLPGLGLLLWTIGFGILHIIYGAVLYRKYDRSK